MSTSKKYFKIYGFYGSYDFSVSNIVLHISKKQRIKNIFLVFFCEMLKFLFFISQCLRALTPTNFVKHASKLVLNQDLMFFLGILRFLIKVLFIALKSRLFDYFCTKHVKNTYEYTIQYILLYTLYTLQYKYF